MQNDKNALPKPLQGETSKSYQAFTDYCRLGASRSITKLYAKYHDSGMQNTPTTAQTDRTIRGWSCKYNWVERAKQYDANVQKSIEKEIKALRVEVLNLFGQRVLESLKNVDVSGPSISQVSSAVRAFFDSSFAQYDEVPSQTINMRVDQISEASDEELRAEARKLLKQIKEDRAQNEENQ